MFRTWKSKIHQGINFGRNSFLSSLLYADDEVIIYYSEDKMQRAIFKLNKIADNYNLKISVTKTKTTAFKGKHPIRTKMVINDTILEQVSHLKYLGSDISYKNNKDIDEKVSKFRHICGSVHRNLKNKT
jgi:uncharacterized membrane protein YgaE (UPF0421/DUF939 family)